MTKTVSIEHYVSDILLFGRVRGSASTAVIPTHRGVGVLTMSFRPIAMQAMVLMLCYAQSLPAFAWALMLMLGVGLLTPLPIPGTLESVETLTPLLFDELVKCVCRPRML